jgi:hypothetical protein
MEYLNEQEINLNDEDYYYPSKLQIENEIHFVEKKLEKCNNFEYGNELEYIIAELYLQYEKKSSILVENKDYNYKKKISFTERLDFETNIYYFINADFMPIIREGSEKILYLFKDNLLAKRKSGSCLIYFMK